MTTKKCLGKGLGALIKTDAQRMDRSKEYEEGNISKIDFKRLEFYKCALKQALSDGMISPDEGQMLKNMREYLKITDEEQAIIEKEVLSEIDPKLLEAAAKRKEDAKDVAVEHGMIEEKDASQPSQQTEEEPMEIRAKTEAREEDEVEEVDLVEVDEHTRKPGQTAMGHQDLSSKNGAEESAPSEPAAADDDIEFEEVPDEEPDDMGSQMGRQPLKTDVSEQANKPKPPPPPEDGPEKRHNKAVVEWGEEPEEAPKLKHKSGKTAQIEWD